MQPPHPQRQEERTTLARAVSRGEVKRATLARHRTSCLAAFVLVFLISPVQAWLAPTHIKATRAALSSLNDTNLPRFFLDAGDAIAHEATLPDALRNRDTHELFMAERSEHFFDLELLQGRQPPPTRDAFIALCHELNIKPEKIGYLPYAIVEQTQRLTIAFAEHRCRPDDPTVRARCLIIAGALAHYTQDMAQPLHVTIHFDGKPEPGTGIHKRMDALPGLVDIELPPITPRGYERVAVEHVMPAIQEANRLVNRVYELEKDLPHIRGGWQPTPAMRELAADRLRAAVIQTADAYLSAWKLSETLQLPDWLVPEPTATQPAKP